MQKNSRSVSVFALIIAAFASLLYFHMLGLWAEEYYQYFPFVLAAVVWFMFDRWPSAAPSKDSPILQRLCWMMLVGGFLLLTIATVVWSPWLASFAFVIVMGSVALHIWRTQGRITNQFGIWALLWLLVPIPLQFDHRLVVRLQQISSWMSSHVLDVLRIDHLMAGTTLQLPDKQFFVDEACSGIVSVMSVIAVGAIYVVYRNRTLPHSLTLLLLGLVWAVFMNVGRITSIAVAHEWFGIDLSTGWQHDVLGLVLFSMTFVAMVSSDALLSFIDEPITNKSMDGDVRRNPMVRGFNYLVGMLDPQPLPLASVSDGSAGAAVLTAAVNAPAAGTVDAAESDSNGLSPQFVYGFSAVCLLLCGLQLLVLARGYRDPETPVELAKSLDATLLPDKVGDWDKVSFESVERDAKNEFGNFSKQYVYRHRDSGQTVIASLDFPYRGGWHELSVCYRNFGWPLLDRTVTDVPVITNSGEQVWPVIKADYEKSDGQHGFLAFSGTNGTADCLEPPSALVLWRPWFRLRRRLLHRVSPRFFQFQAWLSTNEEITQETKDDVVELFLALRPVVLQRIAAGAGTPQ